MTEKDFQIAMMLPIGKEHWVGNDGLKKVIGGVVMMFHNPASDTISAAAFIPINNHKWTKKQ
jgi:hypothetical protein